MLRRVMRRTLGVSRVMETLTMHGSAVAVKGRGLLILGRSGAGKSALALRLVALGAALVADDQVTLTRRGEALIASAPAALAGMAEARGVGLLRLAHVPEAVVRLAVDLDFAPAARMPQLRALRHLEVGVELIFGRDLPNLDPTLMFLLQNGKRVPA